MMTSQHRIRETVCNEVIVYAIIILIGIVTLAAGYFFRITILFYCGLFITLAGILMEIQFIFFQEKR